MIIVTNLDGINILVRKVVAPVNVPEKTATNKTEQEPTIDDPFA
jgi:hypothetical protein